MAWSSYDLDRMVRALSLPTHAVTRYYLLASLLEQSYTRRTFPYWRRTCLAVGQMLIDEFPGLRAAVRRELDGMEPSHPAVERMATILTEDGDYDAAVRLCDAAISRGDTDGAVGHYLARIDWIRRQQQEAAHALVKNP
jgi:hypothetical protein